MENLHELLAGKWEEGTRPKDLYARLVKPKPDDHAAQIVTGLVSTDRKVRNGCAELASLLSADRPDLLYPSIDLFFERLDAREPVVRWEAACTLGNLTRVDRDQRIVPAVDKLILFLEDKSIVLQGHAAKALAKGAAAYPRQAPRILDALVASAERFPGSRVGYLVEAMATFLEIAGLGPRARAFAARHANSDIKSVSAKAKRVLRAAGPAG
jgi:hypothetical protein